jgi:xanthine dehydrogenase accessory factor
VEGADSDIDEGAAAGTGEGIEELAALDDLAAYAHRNDGVKLFVLVATMGESDEDMLTAALDAQPDYLGVIASRRRMEEITATLRARGVADELIAAIDGPAGLDLGATRPEEIAVSVLARIVEQQRRQDVGDLASPRAAAAKTAPQPAARGTSAAVDSPSPTAVDPVCGMTVPADGSRPHADHAGTTYHFCCGGCRDRFVADPDQFVEAAAADPGARP